MILICQLKNLDNDRMNHRATAISKITNSIPDVVNVVLQEKDTKIMQNPDRNNCDMIKAFVKIFNNH